MNYVILILLLVIIEKIMLTTFLLRISHFEDN